MAYPPKTLLKHQDKALQAVQTTKDKQQKPLQNSIKPIYIPILPFAIYQPIDSNNNNLFNHFCSHFRSDDLLLPEGFVSAPPNHINVRSKKGHNNLSLLYTTLTSSVKDLP